MKRRTTKAIVRGHVRALRREGYEILGNGRVRNSRGRVISKATLEKKVRSLASQKPPRLRDVTPKPPRKVKMAPFEEPKPGIYGPRGERLRPREKPAVRLVFERGPEAVESEARRAEKRRLRAILGYAPTRAQLDRAMREKIKEKKRGIPKVTWEFVDRWLVQQSKYDMVPLTRDERRELLRKYSLDFYSVMAKLEERGVLDDAKFRRVASVFGYKLHDVYNVFFGYPPTVGSRAA